MTTDASSVKSLKAFAARGHLTIEPADLVKALESESDRVVVIVVGSVLEDRLAEAIKTKLKGLTDETEKRLRLFDYSGPLGSFSLKINMALALDIIDTVLLEELHIIREMRNACAHSIHPIDFKTRELANVCKRLFTEDKGFITINTYDHDVLRSAFLIEGAGLLQAIARESRIEALKHINKVLKDDPDDVLLHAGVLKETP